MILGWEDITTFQINRNKSSSSISAVLLGLGELALDLLEHGGRRPRRRELQLERARRLQVALGVARRVLEPAGDLHLHLEEPRRVLPPERAGAGAAQRGDGGAVRDGGEVVHPGLPGPVLLPLVGEQRAVERLAVEGVRGLELLPVGDGHGPVPVADGERQREVVRERRRRRGGLHQVEPGQRGVLDGDAHVGDEAVGGEGDSAATDGGGDGEADDAGLPTVPAPHRRRGSRGWMLLVWILELETVLGCNHERRCAF
jgi:hypothetical protein